MNTETRIILNMIYNSINNNTSEILTESNTNWNQVFQIAIRNKIAPLLCDQFSHLSKQHPIDDSLLQSWKQYEVKCAFMEYPKKYALKILLETARKKCVMLTVFKGPILADLYPNYALRSSCDTDILIHEEDMNNLFELLDQLEYERNEISEKNVYTFVNQKYGHKLELHTTLYGAHTGPKIDQLIRLDLARKETLRETIACGIEITTLGYTEQLIYLMFHMIKHFTLEGITIRHLLDIVLYINKYHNFIDKKYFWSAMRELNYESCCTAFFSVGIQYLGLSKIIIEENEFSECKVVEDLLLDMIGVGETNYTEKKPFQIWGMMQPYLVGTVNERKSVKSNYMHFFKPDQKKYEYARKYKILLPICWIHKSIIYMKKGYLFDKKIYSPFEKVKKAENRLDLFEEIGLLNRGD